MAKKMIARTIKTTEVDVLALDLITAEPCNIHFTLAGAFKKESDILKACVKLHHNDAVKLVHVVNVDEVENLYGIPEEVFIANATIINK